MTTAQLAPTPVFKAFDNNGLPLAGGKLYTYAAGTTTPQNSYPSSSESTPNSNPVILNARGECALWFDPALSYKLNLTDAAGNQIPNYPVDNIPGGISLINLVTNLIPSVTNTYNLGSALFTWANGYFGTQIYINGVPVLNNGAVSYWPQTAAETAASVTPTSYNLMPLYGQRYGMLFDNSTDDTTALINSISVAAQAVNGAIGAAIQLPITGVSLLSSEITLSNRVRLLGYDKRGTYFQAKSSWVPSTSPWMFHAVNGTSSMFDSTLENLSVDCNNTVGLGGILSDAWQEDCGLRGALVINFGTVGIKFQNGYGGAATCKIVDTEIFGGSIATQTITGITKAASAVVTISTVSVANPLISGSYLYFASVVGMTQINGLYGQITALGGSSGAWTATVNINSSGFTAYSSGGTAANVIGIDLTTAIGAVAGFMLDVSNTVVVGGSGGNLCAGIAVNGNSLLCRQVHFETVNTGILIDGNGFISLDDVNGASTVTTLVTIASTFTGTLIMKNCRRNAATNFLVDLRSGGYGTITGTDHPLLIINGDTTESAKGLAFCSAWVVFEGSTATIDASYNVTSVTRNSAGNYTIALTRAMQTASAAISVVCNAATSGIQYRAQNVSVSTVNVFTYVAGVATDEAEIKVLIFGG